MEVVEDSTGIDDDNYKHRAEVWERLEKEIGVLGTASAAAVAQWAAI